MGDPRPTHRRAARSARDDAGGVPADRRGPCRPRRGADEGRRGEPHLGPLRDRVDALAGGLAKLGVRRGDPPMTARGGRDWRRPVRLLRGRPAVGGGLRGRSLRRAADAVWPGARRRRADHPKIKSVTRVYDKTAQQAGLPLLRRCRARRRRHARGAARALSRGRLRGRDVDRQPARDPGEDRHGSLAATEFVAWYNGHPDFADPEFDLSASAPSWSATATSRSTSRGCWCSTPTSSRATDTADHAIEAFGARGDRGGHPRPPRARAGRVHQPGAARAGRARARRRGRRSGRARARSASAAWLASDDASPTTRRNVEIMREFAARGRPGKSHRVELRFLRSPVELLGDGTRPSTGLRVVRNRLEPDPRGGVRAVATGEEESSSAASCSARSATAASAAGRPVRRAPRPDPQRRRAGVRRRRQPAGRVRRRLDQARPDAA